MESVSCFRQTGCRLQIFSCTQMPLVPLDTEHITTKHGYLEGGLASSWKGHTVKATVSRGRVSSNQHPCVADKPLTRRVSQLQKAALSQATQQAYRTELDRYKLFCDIYSIIPRFPTTCYFSAYLSEQVQYPTVKLYQLYVPST